MTNKSGWFHLFPTGFSLKRLIRVISFLEKVDSVALFRVISLLLLLELDNSNLTLY